MIDISKLLTHEKENMKKLIISFLVLFTLISTLQAASTPPGWYGDVMSLVSKHQFKEAGEMVKNYCVEKKSGELCLIMASAYLGGDATLGIKTANIIDAFKYTKLACDYGSEEGCKAYKGAVDKGELLQYVLFEPDVTDRDAKLKEAIHLGMDLNVTTMFTRTLLQKAISDEKFEAVKLLISNGVDVNYRVNDDDLTPLMYAINTGNKEMVTLLLKNGADPTQKMKVPEYLKMEKKEANACDFAKTIENQAMITLLKCKNAAANKE